MSAFSAGSIQAWEKHRTRINTGRVKRQEVPVSRLGSFAARHEEAIAFPLTSALVGSSFSPCAGRPPLLLLRADGGGGGGWLCRRAVSPGRCGFRPQLCRPTWLDLKQVPQPTLNLSFFA